MKKTQKNIFVLVIAATMAVCSISPAIAVDQENHTKKKDEATQQKQTKKNNLWENTRKEGWAERDLRKKGYDPETMTGKDIRKMMGVE